MGKGIIYVCSTAVEGLIKIGKTNDFEKRMMALEKNGYRNVSGLKRQFAIEVENYNEIEILLDDLFSKSKVGNTELFSMDLNKVIQLLCAFQGRKIYPAAETKEEVFERATEAVQMQLLPNGEYFLDINQKNGSRAQAVLTVNNGVITLKKGATISDIRLGATNNIKKLSKSLNVKNNVLQKDTVFTSISFAASVVRGINSNGWKIWRDKSGKLIDTYRNKTNEES